MTMQNCAICAWRETCNKRFSVSDNGARCPDYCRDIRFRPDEKKENEKEEKE